MAYAAAATVGVGLATGLMGADAARSASDAQQAASKYAADLQNQQYQQTREDNKQWREAGGRALTQMEDPGFQKDFSMSDYQADPGYAFRMAEGQKALERSAAARGNRLSGGTMKALTQYSQGVASDEYGKAYERYNNNNNLRFNRLASVAGVGQTAVNQTTQAGMNATNNMADAAMQGANASASGTVGQANAVMNGVNSGINNWMTLSQMNKKPTGITNTLSTMQPTSGYLSTQAQPSSGVSLGNYNFGGK